MIFHFKYYSEWNTVLPFILIANTVLVLPASVYHVSINVDAEACIGFNKTFMFWASALSIFNNAMFYELTSTINLASRYFFVFIIFFQFVQRYLFILHWFLSLLCDRNFLFSNLFCLGQILRWRSWSTLLHDLLLLCKGSLFWYFDSIGNIIKSDYWNWLS